MNIIITGGTPIAWRDNSGRESRRGDRLLRHLPGFRLKCPRCSVSPGSVVRGTLLGVQMFPEPRRQIVLRRVHEVAPASTAAVDNSWRTRHEQATEPLE